MEQEKIDLNVAMVRLAIALRNSEAVERYENKNKDIETLWKEFDKKFS